MNIHDRARQLSAQSGVTMSAAYSELSRRSAVKRRSKSRLCTVPAGGSDITATESPRRMWLPYSDN